MPQLEGSKVLLRPINELARDLKIAPEHIEPYGRDKAKVRLEALQAAEATRPPGKLILVSAITPTPAGEGKTTTSIGLAQGLCRIGKPAALALRQSHLGPGDPATLETMNDLARSYMADGKIDRAVELLKKAYDLKRVLLGPDHLGSQDGRTVPHERPRDVLVEVVAGLA